MYFTHFDVAVREVISQLDICLCLLVACITYTGLMRQGGGREGGFDD